MAMQLQCLLLVLFFIGSWFFSGFESGIVSINRHRLIHLVRHGDRAAKALSQVLSDTHRLLATVLVGNNICNVSLTTLVGSLACWLSGALDVSQELLQIVATMVMATLVLIVGEFLPKMWFTARPIERCSRLLGPFKVFRTLFYPLASLCILLTRLVTWGEKEKRSPFVTRENINFLTQDSQLHGEISAFERIMIKRVLELQLTKATDIMTPIDQVVKVYASDNMATVLRVFRQSHHRLLPLFSEDGTQCLGVLQLFDLLRRQATALSPLALRRMPVFVHKDTPADELLPYMRVRATKILIVQADNQPIGIVTQDDVLRLVMDDKLLDASTLRSASAS